MVAIRKNWQCRGLASGLAQFNYERWTRDSKVITTVKEIRSYYFPRMLRKREKAETKDSGLSMSKALYRIRELATEKRIDPAIVLEAKCLLAGEKYQIVLAILCL